MQLFRKVFCVASCAIFVAACGGGSSAPVAVAPPPAQPPTVLVGTFTDSAVQGLSFATATQSGVTDAAGTFMYIDGEIITFSIGGTVIGEAVAATSAMTPRDLVPG